VSREVEVGRVGQPAGSQPVAARIAGVGVAQALDRVVVVAAGEATLQADEPRTTNWSCRPPCSCPGRGLLVHEVEKADGAGLHAARAQAVAGGHALGVDVAVPHELRGGERVHELATDGGEAAAAHLEEDAIEADLELVGEVTDRDVAGVRVVRGPVATRAPKVTWLPKLRVTPARKRMTSLCRGSMRRGVAVGFCWVVPS
jgi:hypothetical protein